MKGNDPKTNGEVGVAFWKDPPSSTEGQSSATGRAPGDAKVEGKGSYPQSVHCKGENSNSGSRAC
jgi:hypothetical protein